ncbi:hypothetical protein OJAV_G00059100 [Oryzias javanicus]|uniref:Uncharacterized protein n=1 Tax=Oryzias javanicus TaxID=123683 RepID=A0A3S2PPC5_ORYJA|nr:hypothetical protein OJAV_G00059100 [Oryzias javanicus]
MRFLWISCLLIGSISCLPQGGYKYPGQYPSYEKPSAQSSGYSSPQGYYSAGTNTAGGSSDSTPPMWYTASYPEQEPSRPTYQRPAQSSGHSYSGSGSQQSGSQGAQSGAPGGQYQVEQESWSSSSDDEDEPEFTPVSDEDQVTPCSSRTSVPVPRQISSGQRFSERRPLRISVVFSGKCIAVGLQIKLKPRFIT